VLMGRPGEKEDGINYYGGPKQGPKTLARGSLTSREVIAKKRKTSIRIGGKRETRKSEIKISKFVNEGGSRYAWTQQCRESRRHGGT